MEYIAYTIFTDTSLATVKTTADICGEKAALIKRTMRNIKGSEIQVGDVIEGCRIDRLNGNADPV